jgi:hypothetical protein
MTRRWVRAALFVGLVYFLVGRLFAVPTGHVQLWRFAAWLVSGVAFAAHIGYEHVVLRNRPRSLALHAATAVAIGALGLAVAGFLHSVGVPAAPRSLWGLALVVWPLATGIPAFAVAFVLGILLARVAPQAAAPSTGLPQDRSDR